MARQRPRLGQGPPRRTAVPAGRGQRAAARPGSSATAAPTRSCPNTSPSIAPSPAARRATRRAPTRRRRRADRRRGRHRRRPALALHARRAPSTAIADAVEAVQALMDHLERRCDYAAAAVRRPASSPAGSKAADEETWEEPAGARLDRGHPRGACRAGRSASSTWPDWPDAHPRGLPDDPAQRTLAWDLAAALDIDLWDEAFAQLQRQARRPLALFRPGRGRRPRPRCAASSPSARSICPWPTIGERPGRPARHRPGLRAPRLPRRAVAAHAAAGHLQRPARHRRPAKPGRPQPPPRRRRSGSAPRAAAPAGHPRRHRPDASTTRSTRSCSRSGRR